MEHFLAKSDRQFGICVRMLNDEGFTRLVIESEKNDKNRMEIRIFIEADKDVFERLNERYQTLIS